MFKVTFHMKSGKSVTFKCEKLTIQKQGNELVGYEITGKKDVKNDTSFYVRLSEIESITSKTVWW